MLMRPRAATALGWFSSTVHISFAEIWRGSRFTDDESVWPILEQGGRGSSSSSRRLSSSGEAWLVGDEFSAADSYALIFFRWGKRIGTDMGGYPRWAALNERTLARPAVQAVLKREGWETVDFRAG